MNLRYSLLAAAVLAIGLVGSVDAEEVQISVTGTACTFGPDPSCNTPAGQSPFTAIFDVNTSGAQLTTPNFYSDCLGQVFGNNIGFSNASGSVGGVSVSVPTSGLTRFAYFAESGCTPTGQVAEFDIGGPGNFRFHATFPSFTQAQYNALTDPLFTLLTEATWGDASFGGGIDGGDMAGYFFSQYSAKVSIISVPEPGVLALVLPGAAALWLTRRRRTNPVVDALDNEPMVRLRGAPGARAATVA